MITGIILGSLALFCTLALYQRVWIKVVWGPDRRATEVRYLFLRFRAPRRHRKVKKAKKAKKERKRWRRGALGWLKLAPELLQAGDKGLRFLLRHSELRHLRLEGSVGTEDAATTGILWGTIWAAHGAIGPWDSRVELAVAPDFDEGNTSLKIDAEGAVRLWALLATAVVILWHLPKRKLWRLLREQRRMKKAARRAGLKSNLNPKKEVEAA